MRPDLYSDVNICLDSPLTPTVQQGVKWVLLYIKKTAEVSLQQSLFFH